MALRLSPCVDASADERTLCERASDNESNDGRPSGELSEGDHDILESEDEREKLLTQKDGISGLFSNNAPSIKIGKRHKKGRRRGGNRTISLRLNYSEFPGRWTGVELRIFVDTGEVLVIAGSRAT